MIMPKFKTYSFDDNLENKSEFYDKEEWAKTRMITNKYMRDNKDSSFYQYIFLNESSKLKDAATLSEKYNFEEYSKLLDLGGLPFIQALVIKNKYPHLQLTLTDFDEKSINMHKDLNIFKKVDASMTTFDIKKDTLNKYADKFDLIIMWGLDYVLADSDLIKLFKFINN